MSEKPIGPLRRRMIEDMIMRNFVEKTRNDYIGNRSSALAQKNRRRINRYTRTVIVAYTGR